MQDSPQWEGEAPQPGLGKPAKTFSNTADRVWSSETGDLALDTLAPSFKTMPLTVTRTTVNSILKDMVDLDGDGDMDFLGYTGDVNELFWWENDGSFVFSEHIIATEHDSSFMEGFDMDGDGDMDFVTYVYYPCPPPCINTDPDDIYWWENDGDQRLYKVLAL